MITQIKHAPFNPWLIIAQTGLMIMETILVSIFYQKIFPWQNPVMLIFFIFLSIFLFGYYSAKFLRKVKIKPIFQRWFYVILFLVLLPLTLKWFVYQSQTISLLGLYYEPVRKLLENIKEPWEFIHIIFLLGVIARSALLSSELIDSNQILNSLRIGIVLSFIYGAVFLWKEQNPDVTPLIFYLGISLFTMISSRLAIVSYSKGGTTPENSKKWLLLILGSTVSLLSISIAVGILLGLELSNFITTAFFVILAAIMFLGILIASPIILGLAWIINLISNSLTNAPPEPFESVEVLENPLTKAILSEVDNLESLINAPGIAQIIVYVSLLLALIIMIILFLKKKRWIPPLSQIDETSSSTIHKKINANSNQPDWLTKLRSFSIRQSLSSYQIRRIYNLFLIKCQKDLDLLRKDAETPIEFCCRFSDNFPLLEPDVQLITNAYNLIRYGMVPETKQELDSVKAAWKTISSAIAVHKKH
jgi:hypothetical protein